MNYKIIQDENKLKKFIDLLPELKEDERLYVALFTRAKYYPKDFPHKVPTQNLLKRFICRKDNLFERIKELECAVGGYQQLGQPVPEEALALYIMPNPRSLTEATKNSLMEFTKAIVGKNLTKFNPHREVLNQIHKSSVDRTFIDYDFDDINCEGVYNLIKDNDIVNIDACTFVETRGGCHLLVNIKNVTDKYKKKFYQGIVGLSNCDMRGDNLLPVVGCLQGGFIPKVINFK